MIAQPHSTAQRLAALHKSGLLDTPREAEFDTIATLAQRSLGCKIAYISLIDRDRQWHKAEVGLGVCEVPVEHSFCRRAVEADSALIIEDARADPRFATNPFVLESPFVRFYAGIPIHLIDDEALGGDRIAIGTLCVVDDKPKVATPAEIETLRSLAQVVEICIRARMAAETTGKLAREQQTILQRLAREKRQFRQAERMANIGSWRLNLADQSVEWSDQVFAIHDLPIGTPPQLGSALNFYPPQARTIITSAVARTIETGQPFDVELDLVTAQGAVRRVRSMGELEISSGRPVSLIGVFQDITAQHEMQQALRRTATVDDLTQIANRAGCNEAIDRCFASARSNGTDLALMLIDLDNFKAVNDKCGHHKGDDVLKWVASQLKASYLADCFVGRLGGDEFVVVVSAPDCENLPWLTRRILKDLRLSVNAAGGGIEVSGTIGISRLDRAVDSGRDLLKRADLALYQAKAEKRGTAKMFGGSSIAGSAAIGPLPLLRVVS